MKELHSVVIKDANLGNLVYKNLLVELHKTENIVAKCDKRFFRQLLGLWAQGFTFLIECSTDPNNPCLCDFSAVVRFVVFAVVLPVVGL